MDKALNEQLALYNRLRFVTGKLIPYFKRLTHGRVREDRSKALGALLTTTKVFQAPAGLGGPVENLVEEVLGGDVLLLGQNVYGVTWIAGDVRPRDCFLQVEGERYSVQKGRQRHLMSLDAAFRAKLKAALRGNIIERENTRLLAQARTLEKRLDRLSGTPEERTVLYRDRERSVMIAKDNTIFCCLEVPPFVMEGADRKYRLFERIQTAIKLTSLIPEEVLSENGACLMAPYDHVFVFNDGNMGQLCMGHDYGFFRRFWQMPLERGIAEYLNAARLVICAGHFDELGNGNGGYVPSAFGARPVISLKKARERKLPVYQYYRTGRK